MSDLPTTITAVLAHDAAATPGEWFAGRSDMVSYGLNDGPWKNIYVDDPRVLAEAEAHRHSANHIRTTNWAPPEEDSK